MNSPCGSSPGKITRSATPQLDAESAEVRLELAASEEHQLGVWFVAQTGGKGRDGGVEALLLSKARAGDDAKAVFAVATS